MTILHSNPKRYNVDSIAKVCGIKFWIEMVKPSQKVLPSRRKGTLPFLRPPNPDKREEEESKHGLQGQPKEKRRSTSGEALPGVLAHGRNRSVRGPQRCQTPPPRTTPWAHHVLKTPSGTCRSEWSHGSSLAFPVLELVGGGDGWYGDEGTERPAGSQDLPRQSEKTP